MIQATVGFAADEQGRGLAYARLSGRGGSRVLRLPFSLKRYPGLLDREVGYAALDAVAKRLRSAGVERVTFAIDDPQLLSDVAEHREVPLSLSLAYVRLGCALNQFREYHLHRAGEPAAELTARARAEVALHIAA
ncbi:MAG: hypothetical protein ABI182_09085 [Candidatus Baltobacteraceae bacterium]